MYNSGMVFIWDYDINELKKTPQGRLKILARMINDGLDKGEKIPLAEVKKNWDKLDMLPRRKRLMELLIWGKCLTSPKNNKSFWMK